MADPIPCRMIVVVEVDEHGRLEQHDTAAMTSIDWWLARGAVLQPLPTTEQVPAPGREVWTS